MMPQKTLNVSLVLSPMDYCNFLLAGFPQSLVSKLQSPKLCSPSCSPFTSTCSRHSNTQTPSPVGRQSPNFLLYCIPVSTPPPPSRLLISLAFYICTLLFDLFAPVSTPASSKCHSVSARRKVIVVSLILVLLSGNHCH